MGYPNNVLERVKRFLDEVSSNKNECWIWPMSKTKKGYGQLIFSEGGKRALAYAHRASYEIAYSDPGEKFVCHKCDNPSCFNPEHLFAGSPKENWLSGFSCGMAS